MSIQIAWVSKCKNGTKNLYHHKLNYDLVMEIVQNLLIHNSYISRTNVVH